MVGLRPPREYYPVSSCPIAHQLVSVTMLLLALLAMHTWAPSLSVSRACTASLGTLGLVLTIRRWRIRATTLRGLCRPRAMGACHRALTATASRLPVWLRLATPPATLLTACQLVTPLPLFTPYRRPLAARCAVNGGIGPAWSTWRTRLRLASPGISDSTTTFLSPTTALAGCAYGAAAATKTCFRPASGSTSPSAT